jgi:NAD(P) transhydrogenase subunit alpha
MQVEDLKESLQESIEHLDKAQSSLESLKQAAQNTVDMAESVSEQAAIVVGVDPFIFRFAIFILSIFIGYYVVWSVTPSLHTPLMAVTNAISSVIVVGALLAVGAYSLETSYFATHFYGFLALLFASINIFGGFFLTHRMLEMYKKKNK